MAFLILGSDAHFSFRRDDAKSIKHDGKNVLTAMHGDLVLVRTLDRETEVMIKLKGFGFCEFIRGIFRLIVTLTLVLLFA